MSTDCVDRYVNSSQNVSGLLLRVNFWLQVERCIGLSEIVYTLYVAKLSLSTNSYSICHKRLAGLVADGLIRYFSLPVDVEDSFWI